MAFSCLREKTPMLCVRCGFFVTLGTPQSLLVTVVTCARSGKELLGEQRSSKSGPAFPDKINTVLIFV